MKLKSLVGSWEGAKKVASVSMVTNVILATALLVAVGKLAGDHERVVLTPPHLTEKVTVGWNTADAPYIKSVAMYFALLTGNVTPKNAAFIADSLSTLVAPADYPTARKQILALAKDPLFQRTGASVRYDVNEVVYEPETSKAFVLGEQVVKDATGREEKSPVVSEFIVRIEDGRPRIYAPTTYPGLEPRTKEWLQMHPQQPASAPAEGDKE